MAGPKIYAIPTYGVYTDSLCMCTTYLISMSIFFFFLAALLSLVSCGLENLTPINDGCICPGGVLKLNCTAVGTGITTWTGMVFTQVGCSGAISLPHSQFPGLIARNESRFCPDMAPVINIKPFSIVDECYTSQLTVLKAGADLNGNTIVCQHDIVGTTEIGSYTIEYTTGEREGEKERERRGREREKGERGGGGEKDLFMLTFH